MELYAINSPSGWTDLIYAGSQRIAAVAGTQTAAPIYDVVDHLGSEVATVNGGTGAQSSLDYTPYGQVLNGTNSDGFIFTGLQRDPDGLDHADMRQYTSTAGRWITSDPYSGSYDIENPQSLNRYAYVNNNPLGFVDPSGETGAGVLPGVGGSFCLGYGPSDGKGNFNLCNPVISAASLGIAELFGIPTTSSLFATRDNPATQFVAGDIAPIIGFATTVGCGFFSSSDTKSAMCGQSGWTSVVFTGKNKWVGTAINDTIATVGLVDGVEMASDGLKLSSCFAGGWTGLNPACDVAIALLVYNALNDIFALVWDLIHPNNFKGSMIPRPGTRGGSNSTLVGVPDQDKLVRSKMGP